MRFVRRGRGAYRRRKWNSVATCATSSPTGSEDAHSWNTTRRAHDSGQQERSPAAQRHDGPGTASHPQLAARGGCRPKNRREAFSAGCGAANRISMAAGSLSEASHHCCEPQSGACAPRPPLLLSATTCTYESALKPPQGAWQPLSFPLRGGSPGAGNCIACNDYVALVHTDIDQETEEIIADVLGVEVRPRQTPPAPAPCDPKTH